MSPEGRWVSGATFPLLCALPTWAGEPLRGAECHSWQTAWDGLSSLAALPCQVPNRLPDVTQTQGVCCPEPMPQWLWLIYL